MSLGLTPIGAQVEAMAALWPDLELTEQRDRWAVWQGMVQPTDRRYRVRISYEVPFAIERFQLIAVQPRVQILYPLLEAHAEYDEGPIPHVYLNKREPDLPFLCLFDPYNREWTPADLLAETTVPWTARYLFFYEAWLATRVWHGGGRHPTRAERLGDRIGDKTLATV